MLPSPPLRTPQRAHSPPWGPFVRVAGSARGPRVARAFRAGRRGEAVGGAHRRRARRGPYAHAALPQLPGLRAGRHAPAVRGPGVHPAAPVAAPGVRALSHGRQRAPGRPLRPHLVCRECWDGADHSGCPVCHRRTADDDPFLKPSAPTRRRTRSRRWGG
ncbi:RING finger family 4 domain-containing protein [Streptomyces cyaneofuscatus]